MKHVAPLWCFPFPFCTHIFLLPTELWLWWFSGPAKYWTNALHCKVWSTTQSTELIPFYLVAGHAFNWLLCVVRTRLWDWITFRHQQPQRQRLYNDHVDSWQEHDTVAFIEKGRIAVVNNLDYFTLFQAIFLAGQCIAMHNLPIIYKLCTKPLTPIERWCG